ncbi:G2-specific serine/threonine protein kinase [Knufia obscura]|uniref:non-specific serine/threonine protein kinase n=1 Tax=Knufia obscura TaxID=1635080 RepID=A0ABR0RP55_9EURO|nr:G2-specific serine/threonine protein kinase [Knufia obscura]
MALVPVDTDKYEVLEVIGRGAFGIIRRVKRKADNRILCRKEINYLKMSSKERDQLTAELNILSSLKHPNIVEYIHRDHIKQTQELYMYMEYCGGGDLGGVIKELKQKGKLAKEDFVWRILSQLLAALYRCHYGVDPPEPGNSARPADSRLIASRTNPTILHRDLKPENIFLDGDKAVKLGDFGLSKLMQSHDFASTYVGTPFYMSPEICAAERYTLKSDIWAVGCIMHELCTLEPPFNAQTHLQLVNKIRKGEVAPLPKDYSKELSGVIKSCLSTNPMYRPDTETLINHPFVWMARKQQECIRLTRSVSSEKEMLMERLKRAEEHIAVLEADKITMKADLESQLRREWEVKARLEIDRQVEVEYQSKFTTLRLQFDEEVSKRVKEQLAKHTCTTSSNMLKENVNPSGVGKEQQPNHHSSSTTTAETDWTNTTDLTELSDLSIHSPSTSTTRPIPPKKTKTPFARSKTTFDSPVDIHMADPSPVSISSLNLSPRRQTIDTNQLSGKNLFSKIATNKARLAVPDDDLEDKENDFDDSDDEFVPDLPSPTRPKMQNTDPFKMPPPVNPLPSKARPGGLQRQHTIASMGRLVTKPNLFPTTGSSGTAANLRAGFAAAAQTQQPSQIPRSATEGDLGRKPTSPTQSSRQRRLSKIPSRGDLAAENALQASTATQNNGSTSPIRRAATITNTGAGFTSTKLQSKLASARAGLTDGAAQVNLVAGRTRVELAQARAGGRPMSACESAPGMKGIRVVEKELPPVPVWDPEVLGDDAMPSPFLKRQIDIRSLPGRHFR